MTTVTDNYYLTLYEGRRVILPALLLLSRVFFASHCSDGCCYGSPTDEGKSQEACRDGDKNHRYALICEVAHHHPDDEGGYPQHHPS